MPTLKRFLIPALLCLGCALSAHAETSPEQSAAPQGDGPIKNITEGAKTASSEVAGAAKTVASGAVEAAHGVADVAKRIYHGAADVGRTIGHDAAQVGKETAKKAKETFSK